MVTSSSITGINQDASINEKLNGDKRQRQDVTIE